MKVKGIKKAVGEYRRLIKRNSGHCANIMMNTSTGEVWTDCFISRDCYKSYQDENIISLSYYMDRYPDLNVTMDDIKLSIISLIEDGIIPYFEVNYRRK